MSKVKIQGNASGTGVLTIAAPNTSTDRTITLPDATGTILDNTSTLDATKLSGAITTSSLVVNGTNADLTLAASGNNISFARNSDNYITASGGSSSNLILDGQNRIVLKHNGTEKLRVTTDGLTFNGDTASANALDDYEEGSWTPSLGGSGNRSGTWSNTIGLYTKIGNIVHLYFGITGSNMYFTSERGYQYITGIPFNAANPTHYNSYSGTWSGDAVDKSAGGHVYLNGSAIYMHSANSNPSTVGVSGIGCHIAYRTNS